MQTARYRSKIWSRLRLRSPHAADPKVEKNVVYGMYSGLALLLDVYTPERPDSGASCREAVRQAPMNYGATALKELQIGLWGPPLLKPATPCFADRLGGAALFTYPGAVDDVQRAVPIRTPPRLGIDEDPDRRRRGMVGRALDQPRRDARGRRRRPDADLCDRGPAALQAIVLRAADQPASGGSGLGGARSWSGFRTERRTTRRYTRKRRPDPARVAIISADAALARQLRRRGARRAIGRNGSSAAARGH